MYNIEVGIKTVSYTHLDVYKRQAVISSQICNDTLEDYFKQITGGEGIA